MPEIPNPMTGKTVLVTGGTGGIGKATAVGLAALGAHVGIVGRDRQRAQSAAADISAQAAAHGVDTHEVDVYVVDMSAQAGVRRLAREVLDVCPRLDVLINNVGGYWATRHLTADGLERTFALNHLSPFLLTNLLLDRLKASAPARVVTVSSNAQANGRIDFDDLQGEHRYPGVPERRTHDYKRAGTTNLYAALDVVSGKVIADLTPRQRADEFRRFLNVIDRAVPANLDVHLILDNSSTHKTPAIQRWLVRHPRFTLHFTPTYSSWLNLVERWFAELTNKWLRRGTHRSVRELVASIRTWITNWMTPNPSCGTRPPTRSRQPRCILSTDL